MSAEIDPAKLKVVELRAELSARGLDTKGNKPVLVDRLREALEKEGQKGRFFLYFLTKNTHNQLQSYLFNILSTTLSLFT